jgi:hypothetical protein
MQASWSREEPAAQLVWRVAWWSMERVGIGRPVSSSANA